MTNNSKKNLVKTKNRDPLQQYLMFDFKQRYQMLKKKILLNHAFWRKTSYGEHFEANAVVSRVRYIRKRAYNEHAIV